MIRLSKRILGLPFIFIIAVSVCSSVKEKDSADDKNPHISDHFDGTHYFNPNVPVRSQNSEEAKQWKRRSWISRLIFGDDWPEWPDMSKDKSAVYPPPVNRVDNGEIRITLVNHSTFLIQMDGLNILTDPVWSKRVGPLSWLGVKRHRRPGIRFDDLPPIDVVLVSHNHYDHMDMPTLKRLVKKFHPRALTSLGNSGNLKDAGFESAMEFDWWKSVKVSEDVTVTLVPAQHFSMRSFWDRNETLWGGFVISGPSGNVYFAADTGYGPHFKEIAQRFAPIGIALLPISPFRMPKDEDANAGPNYSTMHTNPSDAVQAHIDLGAKFSLACHFQTFQLGADDFNAAPAMFGRAATKSGLKPGKFVAPEFGECHIYNLRAVK